MTLTLLGPIISRLCILRLYLIFLKTCCCIARDVFAFSVTFLLKTRKSGSVRGLNFNNISNIHNYRYTLHTNCLRELAAPIFISVKVNSQFIQQTQKKRSNNNLP